MELTLLETTCPLCHHAFGLDDDDLVLEAQRFHPFLPTAEVECPQCNWEFAIDADGRVVDDGGLDLGPLFEIDDDGDWIAEDLYKVTCPHCGEGHEVDEPGPTTCLHCRHTLLVADHGQLNDDCGNDNCPYCGSGLMDLEEIEGLHCPGCGSVFDVCDE